MKYYASILYSLDQTPLSNCHALLDMLNEIVAVLDYSPHAVNIRVAHAHVNKPRDSMAVSKTSKE